MTPDNDNSPRLMGVAEVLRATSLSRASVHRLRVRGEFPQAVPLGARRVAFVRSEIETWIRSRIERRAA